jgi:hypothetical protein
MAKIDFFLSYKIQKHAIVSNAAITKLLQNQPPLNRFYIHGQQRFLKKSNSTLNGTNEKEKINT